jgi:hypothetical protein
LLEAAVLLLPLPLLLGAMQAPGLRIATAGTMATCAPALLLPVSTAARAASKRGNGAQQRLRWVGLPLPSTCGAATNGPALLAPLALVPVAALVVAVVAAVAGVSPS